MTTVEPIYTVVCTDTAPSVNWQCQVLLHTWRSVGQAGEFVRLVATPEGGPVPTHVHGRVVTTQAPNIHPETGDHYPPYNRLFSMLEWLRRERPVGTVLFVDPDMVFRAPVTRRVPVGTMVAPRWFGFAPDSRPAAVAAEAAGVSAADLRPITWPALIHTIDLERLLPRWIELTSVLRQETGAWESDMFALLGALAEVGPAVTTDVLCAWTNWPEDVVAGAPIIHYCQTVEGHGGEPLWSKLEYRPWEPIGVDPDAARLDYCRDLLAILTDVVRSKTR